MSVIRQTYYKLNNDLSAVIDTTTDFIIAIPWGHYNYFIAENLYSPELITYTIQYYNGVNLLNTANFNSTKQKTIRNMYNDSESYSSGTYANLQLGTTYIYNNVAFTLPFYALTGYNNLQWNTKSDLTGTNYNLLASYTTNSSVNFYIKKTGITYTLNYNLNSGSLPNNPATISVIYGSSYTIPSPTRTNYTFNGWYTDSSLQTTINSSGTWSLTTVTNLYAKFTVNGYNLTYNTNGIGGTNKTYNTVIVGTTPTIPIPKAFGYTFNGWYDAVSGGTKKINSDGSGEYTMPAVATTLYAQWTVKSDVRFSYLENTYGNIIAGNNRISISEYQSSISKPTSSRTALKADFIGKGPNL